MRRRYTIALLVIGIALVLGTSMFPIGAGFKSVGILLSVFAGGALLWEALHRRRQL